MSDALSGEQKDTVHDTYCEPAIDHGFCAICLEKILLEETAHVTGCEHAYCATCILRWASYNANPSCPQCKHPFLSLLVHRSLDGRIHDYMFEESVCLLLRAPWYTPVTLETQKEAIEEQEEHQYEYDDVDDYVEDAFYGNMAGLRIGNRRWGDGGYVRAGRKEAMPIVERARSHGQEAGGSSRAQGKKPASREEHGRRAKRAQKREAADKAAAAKHQEHLQRMGRI
ncbi:hypothetical protein AMTRI_Chr07g80410 [Amborella trichopoda]